ncbi:ABC transporter substrate-binding protein [Acidaminobacter hydrogenoformans]|uniref:ABC-type nitrate/sulfonate/bicarbonate transport system, substrate-binding protein n=1 Tax=Acidaminobacter hydrogenoformans DSM 2784 TaxID=1120920 RepID=A0A1G5S2L2_9FIRM|nr:ABC transporter substrate-binding protein [Acidaminobacter hydrogenoformans]SCZ80090.1 ABC-type nitrate/sulfonate/bicarbonate transport system, substrate-binding protein [Acidaminobacter hydrogenoformans DSM 2784]
MRKLNVIGLILILAAALALAGCQQTAPEEAGDGAQGPSAEPEKVTVVLDWVPNTNHTGLYVAQDLGFYEEAGLDVEIIQPAEGGSASLIAAGQGEFGISYQEEITYARTAAEPLPVKAIAAIIQHNTSGFASPVEKGIVTPKDFEGKKYGGWGSPAEVAVLSGLMAKEGADFTKLEMVDLGALDFFAATQNHVDFTWIYYGWDGIAAEVNEVPINFILLQDFEENLDFYTPVIIAKEDTLSARPELVEKFLAATSKGYEYAMENPEEAVKSLLKAAPEVDEKIAVASQIYLADQYQADASQWGIMDLQIWSNYAGWMFENGLIESELDAEGAFTNDFLPKK